MSPLPQLTTPTQTAPSQLSLNDWASRCLNLPDIQVQCWQRESAIDILCEGEVCPEVSMTIDRLTEGLKTIDLQTLLPPEAPKILMICVHGRIVGRKRPNWTVRLDPHHPDTAAPPPEMDMTLPQYQKLSATMSDRLNFADRSSGVTERSRSGVTDCQGDRKAIADYLSQTLKSWGLGVKVIVKIQTLETSNPETSEAKELHPTNPWATTDPVETRNFASLHESQGSKDPDRQQKRLWVVCQSAYSPEPLSIAAPLGARLRQLDLQGFKDAVILGQVSGEKQPEWILRVDLTPAKEMLHNWARWGDVQAITKLLHQRLIETLPESFAEDLQVSGVLKESTLHIFFSDPGLALDQPADDCLDKEKIKAAIAPLLESIAPQNIYGITIYGLKGDRSGADGVFQGGQGGAQSPDTDSAPLWVDWLDLPASRHADLAPTTMELASNGNLDALTFLLDRLLNPDLDQKLDTGGVRIAIRHKADLLHIMVDAATCPPRGVGSKVAKFIASLNIPEIGGVRTYGRRSGQKKFSWRVGMDFQSRESIAGDTVPEFSVSEAANNSSSPDQLLPNPGNLVIRPDVKSEDLQACLTKLPSTKLRKKKPESFSPLKQGLILSGMFIPASSAPNNNLTGAKVTVIWAILGLLFTLQMDWLLGEAIALRQYHLEQTTTVSTSTPSMVRSNSPRRQSAELTDSEWSQVNDNNDNSEVFNSSAFTEPPTWESESSPSKPAIEFTYPSFNSQQMDEQLALYAQYVANYGVPDVLIVGSSRALRGIDPALLRRGLADRYPNLRIFNFGVNGATAQVVHLIVRQLLGQELLPELIVWADGARAFNSGRSDRTFEAIASSVGYQELKLGIRPPIAAPESESADNDLASLTVTLADRAKQGVSFADAYQQLDKWLNEQLGSLSATYPQRNQLQNWLGDALSYKPDWFAPLDDRQCENDQNTGVSACEPTSDSQENPLDSITTEDPKSATNINGFLPIELKFDPATYYEQYALVSGDYDADYESFNLMGQQAEAMNNLLGFLQQHQVSLVFVNMPLTQDYLDPIRLKHERTFQKYAIGLALKYGFIFRDFSQEWSTEHTYFSDPSHLNYLGAQRVSESLAQDPLIPWPNPDVKP